MFSPPDERQGLAVNAPGDAREREADRIAELVMRSPEPGRRRQDAVTVQVLPRTGHDEGRSAAPLASGQPLEPATRAFMEARFGHDFSRVRIHADAQAAAAAAALGAAAYTTGRAVVFGAGQYDPSSPRGRHLLAHELTHTLQQEHALSIQCQSIKPTGGSAPYVPQEKDLTTTLSGQTAQERKQFIEGFLLEVYPVWETLKKEGYWDKLANISSLAADKTVTDRLEPIPESGGLTHNKSRVKTRYPDPAVRFTIGPDRKVGEDLLAEQWARREKGIDEAAYADIDNSSIVINRYAQDAGQTTAAVMSLRNVQTVANRFYAAYLASKEANVEYSLSEVLAVYQQEGNKEMPSSSQSLQSD
ncbi:MAG TPA: DUF4157 domain-containing protein, partial [Longimicrobium sp.]|nr:DUF4157 domain-containing protein [Longimicrobium sp.]